MLARVEHMGTTYAFDRDSYGAGYWYATTGRRKNLTVPIILANELRRTAINDGCSPDTFSNRIQTDNSERTIRVRRKNSDSTKGKFSVSIMDIMKKAASFTNEE